MDVPGTGQGKAATKSGAGDGRGKGTRVEILGGGGSGRNGRRRQREGTGETRYYWPKIQLPFAKIATRHRETYPTGAAMWAPQDPPGSQVCFVCFSIF